MPTLNLLGANKHLRHCIGTKHSQFFFNANRHTSVVSYSGQSVLLKVYHKEFNDFLQTLFMRKKGYKNMLVRESIGSEGC